MRTKRMAVCLILFLLVFVKTGFAKNNSDEENKELKFGYYCDREWTATHTIVFNETLSKRITEIGNRVAKASDKPDIKYTFRVINDPYINAYSLSGGFIYINTGLLDVLDNEDELGSLIAHEIAHVNKSHSITAYKTKCQLETTEYIASNVASGIIGLVTGGIVSTSLVGAVIIQGANYGLNEASARGIGSLFNSIVNGYGKSQELEADILAIQYTKKASYDPNAMVSVFKKFASIRDRLKITKENYVSKLINAEPGLEERIKNIEEIIVNTK